MKPITKKIELFFIVRYCITLDIAILLIYLIFLGHFIHVVLALVPKCLLFPLLSMLSLDIKPALPSPRDINDYKYVAFV